MSSEFCDWCEKKRDTVLIFVESGMDEWCQLCRPCAIGYHEDEIFKLKFEQNIEKLAVIKIDNNPPEQESPYKSPRTITGTHCF